MSATVLWASWLIDSGEWIRKAPYDGWGCSIGLMPQYLNLHPLQLTNTSVTNYHCRLRTFCREIQESWRRMAGTPSKPCLGSCLRQVPPHLGRYVQNLTLTCSGWFGLQQKFSCPGGLAVVGTHEPWAIIPLWGAERRLGHRDSCWASSQLLGIIPVVFSFLTIFPGYASENGSHHADNSTVKE